MLKCLNCNKELNKRQIKYCSNQCQSDFQYKQYIKRWKNGEEDGLSGQYALSKYSSVHKERKKQGEVIDEWYRLTLTKMFDDEKEPISSVEVIYDTEGSAF